MSTLLLFLSMSFMQAPQDRVETLVKRGCAIRPRSRSYSETR